MRRSAPCRPCRVGAWVAESLEIGPRNSKTVGVDSRVGVWVTESLRLRILNELTEVVLRPETDVWAAESLRIRPQNNQTVEVGGWA